MKEMKELYITKASGQRHVFSEEKLRYSLRRAGANDETIESIIQKLLPRLYDGISTKEIYGMAFNLLHEGESHLAARYHLKQALMELGPSGFPFERFIAKLLQNQGYKTKVGEIVAGHCVRHEIDVIAEKENHVYMIECKYHNQNGIFCSVKIPLYIQSRFKDVEANWLSHPTYGAKQHTGWVVTNTRFSGDAIQYAICMGLKLLGWDYPALHGLKDQIDALGLYPVTCLTTLTLEEKKRLLDKGIVLCQELHGHEKILKSLGIKSSRIKTISHEAERLCMNLVGSIN